MYCSTCGAPIPSGRDACDTCGTAVAGSSRVTAFGGGSLEPTSRVESSRLAICPKCDFEGRGLPYFNRGAHVAALVGATLFTLPYALGAGGLLYYGVRHDHRICPRCGYGWGKLGHRASGSSMERVTAGRDVGYPVGSEGVKRSWSVMLLILGAIMLTVGAIELEAVLLALGTLATAGGVVLHRGANRAREERRAALMSSLQLPVLKLAAERNGVLTVTDVAASLGWSLRRAERVLQSLDDGWRVDSEVTDEGVIVYEFRELLLGRGGPPEER
ncbi:MAG: hypothetical protein WD766_00890 [Gemmatimonadota bacterium]